MNKQLPAGEVFEKSIEYNKFLVIVFVNYKKVFDSIDQMEMLKSLANCRVDYRYFNVTKYIYKYMHFTRYTHVKMHENIARFKISVECDKASSKFFINLFEYTYVQKARLESNGYQYRWREIKPLAFCWWQCNHGRLYCHILNFGCSKLPCDRTIR